MQSSGHVQDRADSRNPCNYGARVRYLESMKARSEHVGSCTSKDWQTTWLVADGGAPKREKNPYGSFNLVAILFIEHRVFCAHYFINLLKKFFLMIRWWAASKHRWGRNAARVGHPKITPIFSIFHRMEDVVASADQPTYSDEMSSDRVPKRITEYHRQQCFS